MMLCVFDMLIYVFMMVCLELMSRLFMLKSVVEKVIGGVCEVGKVMGGVLVV